MTRKAVFIFCILMLTACGTDLSGKPPFAGLTFSTDFTHITAPDGRAWGVSFEYPNGATFRGVIRHVSRWHESSLPFMTHDILITTGDFASKGTVNVFVVNHKFIYHYAEGSPSGSINLLHIFPASEEIYKQLLQVKDWNEVSISGREIDTIDMLDAEGANRGYFKDHGCNSILVTSVTVHATGTPVP